MAKNKVEYHAGPGKLLPNGQRLQPKPVHTFRSWSSLLRHYRNAKMENAWGGNYYIFYFQDGTELTKKIEELPNEAALKKAFSFKSSDSPSRPPPSRSKNTAKPSKKRTGEKAGKIYSGKELFIKVKPSVAGIATNTGSGSGVFFHKSGVLVTNRHVVGKAMQVIVRLSDSEEFPGRVIISFRDIDIAFIKIEKLSTEKFMCPKMSELASEGETTYAIGDPYGFSKSITKGTISSVGRIYGRVKCIQHDAAINRGNSGGPLFNEKAELIGINTWKYSNSDGLGFALKARDISERFTFYKNLSGTSDSREYCPVCGHSSEQHSKYCENCGICIEQYKNSEIINSPAFVSTDICSCGQNRIADEHYCTRCGQTLLVQRSDQK